MSATTLPRLEVALGGSGPLHTVLVHPAGGGITPYLPLAQHLAGRGPVTAIRASGLLPGERPHQSIEAMVEAYLPLLEQDRPGLLVGWSMGGILVWELAARLAATGPAPAVVVIDSRAEAMPRQNLLERLRVEAGPLFEQARAVTGELDPGVLATIDAHVRANARHTLTAAQSGPALLLVCGDEDVTARLGDWDAPARDLRVRRLPGEHFDVFNPDVLPVLLAHLDDFLRDAS